MITPVYRGENLRRLLGYLYGPGRCEDHHDPHLIAAWDPQILATMDPGRVDGATLTDLARLLMAPVKAHPDPARLGSYVWHCAARVAPQDRSLTDLDWAQIVERLLHAAGIAPTGDDTACRWVAVRHADNHIHIAATLMRQDGRRPRHHNDWLKLRGEAIRLEAELGLRPTAPADRTARKRPTRHEIAKADRLGLAEPARDTLARTVRHTAIASASELEFFLRLSTAGLHVHQRTGPSGSVTGYAVALPGHRTATGQLVWYAGSGLAADLSLPKIRRSLTGMQSAPAADTGPEDAAARLAAWRRAAQRLNNAASLLANARDPMGAGIIAGLGDLATAAARQSPDALRQQLMVAAVALERAARTPAGRAGIPSAVQLRRAARALIRAGRAASTGRELEAVTALVISLSLAARAAAAWHNNRNHRAQAEAAQHAATCLRELAASVPGQGRRPAQTEPRRPPSTQHRRLPKNAHADAVRAAFRGHDRLADKILSDPAWPTLQRKLHRLAEAGRDPSEILAQVTSPRELGSARSPAKVLVWRISQQLKVIEATGSELDAQQLQLL